MGPNDRQARGQQTSAKIEQWAGDRAVQFGQVFGDVVFQLLSPKTAITILATLAIAAVSLFYLYHAAQKPAWMTGDFNIAVAQFGEVTDEGLVSSALATQISKLLFDFLDSEYKATDFGLDIQVAHKKIGILTEDREAEELAYDIGADIVIYGSVFVVGNEAILSPKFYVADQPNTAELTGQHQLALPIRFNITSLDVQDKVNTELRSRAAILVSFTEGLVYLSADGLDKALRSFREAIREADSHGPFDGQEVLYLFAAHTNRRQGDFEKAAEYLDRALFLNPGYARAYIGRGNIYYAQALQASFDESWLDQALVEYERALKAQDHPPGAYVMEKVNIALGNIYGIRAQQTNDPVLFELAIYHYDQVVAQYEKTRNERIKGLAAAAHFGLGAVFERMEEYGIAEDYYQQCIDLASDPDLKSRAERQLDLIEGQPHTVSEEPAILIALPDTPIAPPPVCETPSVGEDYTLWINQAQAEGAYGPAAIEAPAAPSGDAKSIVAKSAAALKNLKSYRVKSIMEQGGQTMETLVEYVLPDKFHMVSDFAEMIVIGDDMYMKAGDTWTKVPGGAAAVADVALTEDEIVEARLEGTEDVEGVPTQKYVYTAKVGDNPPVEATAWIGVEDGLPRKIVTTVEGLTVTQTLYDFNADITIEPPPRVE